MTKWLNKVRNMKQNVGHIINMKKKEDTQENMEQF